MKKITRFLTIPLLLLTGCMELKEYADPETPLEEYIDFDWKTTSEVNLQVSVGELTDQKIDGLFRTVRVYTEPTLEQVSLLATGGALPGKNFNTTLSLPSYTDRLYISVTDGAYRESTYECPVVNGRAILNTVQDISVRSGAVPTPPGITIPDLNSLTELTAETKVVANTSYLVPAGKHVVIDDKDILSAGLYIDSRNASVYVAGTLEIKETSGKEIRNRYITVLNGGKIIGEKLTIAQVKNNGKPGFEAGRPVLYVEKGGKISVTLLGLNANGTERGIFTNYGEVDCERLHLYEKTETHNAGRITVRVRAAFSKNAEVYGYAGSLTESTAQTHTSAQSSQSLMTLYPNAIFHIGGYDKEGNNAGEEYAKGWGTYNTRFYAPENQKGEKALLIINTSDYRPNNIQNRRYVIEGPIDVHIPNLTDAGLKKMKDDGSVDETIHITKGSLASRGEQNGYYIEQNGFNRGYGIFEIIDADGDGVPEGLDVDDTDAEVAYHSFFPSPIRFATVMFEDLWPGTGDYDMNDLVLNFRVEYVMNTDNDVVSMNIKWKPRAAGATKRIGFALQLDEIAPSEIKRTAGTYTVKGNAPFDVENYLEKDQSRAVIPFFNDYSDIFGLSSYVNTRDNYTEANTETTSLYFGARGAGAIKKERLLSDKLNPFITVNGRACEVHLPYFRRTDKGTTVTGDEYLDHYKNSDGMMWGILIPQSIPFVKEGIPMYEAYEKFERWYKSAGQENKEWYKNESAGSNDKLRKEPYVEFH